MDSGGTFEAYRVFGKVDGHMVVGVALEYVERDRQGATIYNLTPDQADTLADELKRAAKSARDHARTYGGRV